MANILTVYFSLKGPTLGAMMKIVEQEKGNTEMAAEYIQQAVGGDLFEIETVKTYPKDHMKTIQEAKDELAAGIRVAIKGIPDQWASYGTVYLGFPNWWGTLPMPVVTFLEQLDWTGKRIIPFCTNEGSGLGQSESAIRSICTGAAVADGASFCGHKVKKSEKQIAEWAKKML